MNKNTEKEKVMTEKVLVRQSLADWLKEQDENDSQKVVDYASLEVDGIDTRDYPDFCNAFFLSGQYTDGTDIPDDVLDDLTSDGDLLYEHILKHIY